MSEQRRIIKNMPAVHIERGDIVITEGFPKGLTVTDRVYAANDELFLTGIEGSEYLALTSRVTVQRRVYE